MTHYAFRAISARGGETRSSIEAVDRRAAIDAVRSKYGWVVDVREVSAPAAGRFRSLWERSTVSARERVFFTRQLSTLVAAGVSLVVGLRAMRRSLRNPAMGSIVDGVTRDLEAGVPMSESLRKHPEVFSGLYIAMVRAGEAGGALDAVLNRLVLYLEAAEELRGKVKSAMMYPLVVALIAAAVTIFLLVGVIPTFREIFASFGATLPLPTRFVIALSENIRRAGFLWAAAGGVSLWLTRRWGRTPTGRRRLDGVLLRVPGVGPLLRQVAAAKFARTLATLVRSGVPILSAMDAAAATAGNVVIEEAARRARDAVRDGEGMSGPLEATGMFPPMLAQMVAVGEESGQVDVLLEKAADYFDGEVDGTVKGLTSVIEPIVIVVMGIVIGGLVIAMFLPMLNLPDVVGRAG